MVGERAQAVYDAINVAPRTWTRGPVSVTISAITFDRNKNLVTVDAALSYNGVPVADDRWLFCNPPTMAGNGTFTTYQSYKSSVAGVDRQALTAAEFAALSTLQKSRLTPVGSTFQRENMAVNPLAALRLSLEDTVRQVTKDFTRPHLMRNPDGTFKGDTLTAFAIEDGKIRTTNSNIATSRAGSGLTTDVSGVYLFSTSFVTPNYIFSMGCEAFDTSALTGFATISACVLSLAGTGTVELNPDGLTAQARFHDYGTGDPTTGDWFNITTTGWTDKPLVGTLAFSSWNETSAAYNAFSDSGNAEANVNKLGMTRVVIGTDMFPTGTPSDDNGIEINSSDAAGTTSDPKLVLTYTIRPRFGMDVAAQAHSALQGF